MEQRKTLNNITNNLSKRKDAAVDLPCAQYSAVESKAKSQQSGEHGYTAAQATRLMDKLWKLRDAQPGVQLDLAVLAEQLTVPRAKTFANEALGRRLQIIARSALNVFRLYPPDRRNFISGNEGSDIAIQLHAFSINVYALFDNIAWICTLEANLNLAPTKINLFKAECQTALPEEFRAYLAQQSVQTWYRDYGKLYRDSTAHRIPPYVPPREFTSEDAARWQELHKESMRVLTDGHVPLVPGALEDLFTQHASLEKEKNELGHNSILMGISLTGEDATAPVYLHPQLLCDWELAYELVRAFTKSMRGLHKWPEPSIPPMVVRGPL